VTKKADQGAAGCISHAVQSLRNHRSLLARSSPVLLPQQWFSSMKKTGPGEPAGPLTTPQIARRLLPLYVTHVNQVECGGKRK
jgi:hypothetical protein